jgi:hypothetical protein
MVRLSPEFLVKCKARLAKLNERKINETRKKFHDSVR